MFPLPELLTMSLQPCVDFLNNQHETLRIRRSIQAHGGMAWGDSHLVQKQAYLHACPHVTMALRVLRVKSTN